VSINPDTLEESGSEELRERQHRTGEMGDGKTVLCVPDLEAPSVVQHQFRSTCLTTPYQACHYCPHHHFELIFDEPQEDWVACPRWRADDGGNPDFYTFVSLSECRDKPYSFCPKCPSREVLVHLRTDKQKHGWLERYRKLTKEVDADD
jgi:hypothetical protein